MHVVYDMILLLVFLLQISTSVWAPNVAQIGPVDLYHRLHLWTITWYIFISNQSSSRLGVFLSSARYKFTVYQLIYLLTGRDVESHNGAQKKKQFRGARLGRKFLNFAFWKWSTLAYLMFLSDVGTPKRRGALRKTIFFPSRRVCLRAVRYRFAADVDQVSSFRESRWRRRRRRSLRVDVWGRRGYGWVSEWGAACWGTLRRVRLQARTT